MKFKEKRAAELQAFHAEMDLYMLVANATEQDHGFRVAQDSIRVAVGNMFAALNESVMTRLLTTARIALQVGEGVSGAMLHDPLKAGAASIQLTAMATETPPIVKRLGPFVFVHEVIKELT